MQIGIDKVIRSSYFRPGTGLALARWSACTILLEEIELADKVGLDVFGIGEHHRAEFLDSALCDPLRCRRAHGKIRLTSAVTVLSASDPVRVFSRSSQLST